jgi:plastocyanin
MKIKFIGLVLAVAAVTLMVACGGGGTESAPEASTETASAPAATAGGGSGSATISGTATYTNGDPDTEIKMDADPVCASLHGDAVHTEKVVHDDAGNLANVFVYVKEGLTGNYQTPADAHVLDQLGCQYSPHVSGMQTGQKLVIRNSDPTLHNVHAMPTINKEFNMGQPFQGMELEHTFDKAEVMVRFKCDVHPWMASYMGVLDHPYFGISGADGSYSIGDLPAGDYVVEAWHEELGTQTQNITVEDGGAAEISFDFSPVG